MDHCKTCDFVDFFYILESQENDKMLGGGKLVVQQTDLREEEKLLIFGQTDMGAASIWPYEYFIEIQDVQMMNGIYGDMTLYGHAIIIGGQQAHI